MKVLENGWKERLPIARERIIRFQPSSDIDQGWSVLTPWPTCQWEPFLKGIGLKAFSSTSRIFFTARFGPDQFRIGDACWRIEIEKSCLWTIPGVQKTSTIFNCSKAITLMAPWGALWVDPFHSLHVKHRDVLSLTELETKAGQITETTLLTRSCSWSQRAYRTNKSQKTNYQRAIIRYILILIIH